MIIKTSDKTLTWNEKHNERTKANIESVVSEHPIVELSSWPSSLSWLPYELPWDGHETHGRPKTDNAELWSDCILMLESTRVSVNELKRSILVTNQRYTNKLQTLKLIVTVQWELANFIRRHEVSHGNKRSCERGWRIHVFTKCR